MNPENEVMDQEEKNQMELLSFLLYAPHEEFIEEIEDIHPADILEIIRDHEEHLDAIFNRLPKDLIGAIIDEAEDEEKYEILNRFSEDSQTEIIEEVSSDELADMIGSLDEEEAQKILEIMTEEDAQDVRQLLTYAPDTAGGIMATEFIAIKDAMTVKETLKYLQQVAPDAESAYYLYVVDDMERLKGVVSLRDFVTSPFETLVADIVNENVISVPYDMDQEEVALKFQKYGFLTMPVVDEEEKMLGIVTVDDIMEILIDETTEDMHRLAGVAEGERVDGTWLESVKSRLPWLFVNLVTAIIASSVVSIFEGPISQVVILATFMPIVAGMGGNAGTQTLTIIVRGLALGEIDKENAKPILVKEIIAGLVNGLATGITMALLGVLWSGKPMFGVVIGVAMVLNLVAATFSGFVVPILLKKMKVDPALASAVFVTTVTDVLGFFFYLGLGTLLLPYLV